MAKQQRQNEGQLSFSFENTSIPMTPMTAGYAAIVHAHLPQPVLPAILSQPEIDEVHEDDGIPVPLPLESAVRKGVFGVDENDDPVEPSQEEVHEISLRHGERLAELFVSLDRVNELLTDKQRAGRDSDMQEKDRLTCQIQGMLGLYAEDFGETAARHLESWARAEAHRDDSHDEARGEHSSTPSAPQYDQGHPWHYLARGDGRPAVPVEQIPASECDGSFVGKLPKDAAKRRTRLEHLLADETAHLAGFELNYRELVKRGAEALGQYDRTIAYGGDDELAVASSLALRFNHIAHSRGRVHWLQSKLGLPLQFDVPSSEAANDLSAGVELGHAAPVSECEQRPAPGSPPVVGSHARKETNNGGPIPEDITTEESTTARKAPSTRMEKLEKLHESVDQALDKLAASLESGRSDTLKAWLTTMSRFHDYSLGNQMLIAWQRPDATHVAGFHAWKKFNRLVNKGEKGIMILAPVTRIVAKVEERDDKGNLHEKSIRKLVNTKLVYVFDVSQTHGDPLPELANVRGDPTAYMPKLKDLIAAKGIELYFADRLPMNAQGISEGGKIGCQKGLPPAEAFRTLSHELAHELLHRGERRKETTKRTRELEAESVAFVVCSAIGLDARQTSTDYIHLYRGDKSALYESLQFIREVSRDILSVLLQSPNRQDAVHDEKA